MFNTPAESTNPTAVVQPSPHEVELWSNLIRDAEPLPNPKRGIFKYRDSTLRMPKRSLDGKVAILTETGEPIFDGYLVGVLQGSETRLVQALNKKVQEIQSRARRLPQGEGPVNRESVSAASALHPSETNRPHENVPPDPQFSTSQSKISVDKLTSLSDTAASVTATVVKGSKYVPSLFPVADQPEGDSLSATSTVKSSSRIETWQRTTVILDTHNSHDQPLDSRENPFKNGSSERHNYSKGEADDTMGEINQPTVSARTINSEDNQRKSIDQIAQRRGGSIVQNSTPRDMVMLHNYVTFQGISLEEGQQVSFVMKGERGWAQIIDANGSKSWVPHSYLEDCTGHKGFDPDNVQRNLPSPRLKERGSIGRFDEPPSKPAGHNWEAAKPDTNDEDTITSSRMWDNKAAQAQDNSMNTVRKLGPPEQHIAENRSIETDIFSDFRREKQLLDERITKLEASADVKLVLELQKELQRERLERDAERKALEEDLSDLKQELVGRKDQCKTLKIRLEELTAINSRLKMNNEFTNSEPERRRAAQELKVALAKNAALEERIATTEDELRNSKTSAPSFSTDDASSFQKRCLVLEKALEEERARGLAWQDTTEELMMQNERLRECIHEQQLELKGLKEDGSKMKERLASMDVGGEVRAYQDRIKSLLEENDMLRRSSQFRDKEVDVNMARSKSFDLQRTMPHLDQQRPLHFLSTDHSMASNLHDKSANERASSSSSIIEDARILHEVRRSGNESLISKGNFSRQGSLESLRSLKGQFV